MAAVLKRFGPGVGWENTSEGGPRRWGQPGFAPLPSIAGNQPLSIVRSLAVGGAGKQPEPPVVAASVVPQSRYGSIPPPAASVCSRGSAAAGSVRPGGHSGGAVARCDEVARDGGEGCTRDTPSKPSATFRPLTGASSGGPASSGIRTKFGLSVMAGSSLWPAVSAENWLIQAEQLARVSRIGGGDRQPERQDDRGGRGARL